MDAPQPTMRVATSADAEAIAALSAQLGYPASTDAIAERLAWIAGLDVVVFVAELGGVPGGWIAVERRVTLESGVAFEITGLVVDSNRRRGSVGRALVDAAESWARHRGATSMTVRSNLAREASHAFYAGIGFMRTKTQHVYRRAIDRDTRGA